jgi:nitroreductase
MPFRNYFTGNIRDRLKNIVSIIKYFLFKVLSINIIFIKIYYIFSHEYNLEMKHVLKGKVEYYHNLINKKSNVYILRRNIHRIEKGMVMQPRRNIFATGFIGETVLAYKNMMNIFENSEQSNPLLEWSSDVLQEYFKITDNHPSIDYAKQLFFEIESKSISQVKKNTSSIPYKRNKNNAKSVNYTDFIELCKVRRSVRWYLDEKVPREILDNAFIAASLSPSACNRQPFEFHVFDTDDKIELISKVPGGTLGFYQNFPGIIVIIGNFDALPFEADRHVPYIDSSLAAMSLMFALESLGISSCPINWRDDKKRENQIRNLLNISSTQRPIMFLSYGYADPNGMIPFSQKKTLNEIRFYNK